MLKTTASWLLWPVLVGGGMLATHVALARGLPPAAALVGLQLAITAIVLVLERVLPEHDAWNVPHHDVRADALHTVLSGIVIAGALRAGIFAFVPSLGLWPAALPVPVQLALALLVADAGAYVTHVLTHRVGVLWPIHAVHHSARRLYWLNASRMHPLDTASTVLISLLPLALLGVPIHVLALFDAFAIVHLLLQHSNVRLRLGLLDHVFASAEFHRWHHSPTPEEGERNYATFFSFLDHLFGTFRMPAGRRPRVEVGLYDDSAPISDGWVAQLRHPFAVWLRARPTRASERRAS